MIPALDALTVVLILAAWVSALVFAMSCAAAFFAAAVAVTLLAAVPRSRRPGLKRLLADYEREVAEERADSSGEGAAS